MKKTWFVLGGATLIVVIFISIGFLQSSFVKKIIPGTQKPAISPPTNLFRLQSPAFANGGNIPEKYTCDGTNIRPPLSVSGTPDGTKSLAIIVYDPDAAGGSFVHWIAWNIPPETKTLPEGGLSGIIKEGKTSFGSVGYIGPCPPSGTHRYVWRMYALANVLTLESIATREDLETGINTFVIAQTEFSGRYTKK